MSVVAFITSVAIAVSLWKKPLASALKAFENGPRAGVPATGATTQTKRATHTNKQASNRRQ